jgi:hypothetical protein
MNRATRFVLGGTAASLILVAGAAAPAHAVSITGGDVPIPAKLVNGVYQQVWDSSYSDLLAADALAACWTTQKATPYDPSVSELDGLINALMSHMGTASCKAGCSNPAYTTWEDISICNYLDTRKDPTCNMDAATHTARALDTSKFRSTTQTQDYVVPSAATMGITGTSATRVVQQAQALMSYAELTLCMAEQLNQKLDTVQVAFASGDDLARVQEMVRERALTAVYEYSVINKTFASVSVPPLVVNGDPFFLIPLSRWGQNFMSLANATRFGDDFAQAIKLLVEATEAEIKLKLRSPDAQSRFGVQATFFGTTVLTGSREEILDRILYDGMDDLGFGAKKGAIFTDTSDPQVGVLLTLARRANALKIHDYGLPQFYSATSGQALYLAVENFLRNDDCTRRGIPLGSCVQANTGTPQSQFMLWQKYRISQLHAQTLTDALTEALFGPPVLQPASRITGVWNYPVLFKGGAANIAGTSGSAYGPAEQQIMHVYGNHQFTGDVTQPYPMGDIILDPNFSVQPVDATDIQGLRPWTRLPARDIFPNGGATDQIGQFRNLAVNVVDSTGSLIPRRTVGSNTVLALAREALLQVSAGPSTPRTIYTEAAPALTLIEKMIGPRQATVRMTVNQLADASCTGCFRTGPRQTTPPAFDMTVDLLSKTTDLYTLIGIGAGIPLASTLAKNAGTRTLFGNTQASTMPFLTWSAPFSVSYVSNYVQRTAPGVYNPTSKFGVSVVLQQSSPQAYQHVWTGALSQSLATATGSGTAGTVVTFGGRFDREATDAWAFDLARWSKPKFDGFGMRTNWTPFADASLFGDAPGVSVERHFVAQAAAAADESAQALQQAFDALQQQALDDAAVASSDLKATQLTSLDYQSLCGGITPNCVPTYTFRAPTVPPCLGATNSDCEAFRGVLGKIIGNPPAGPAGAGIPIASAVNAEINAANPAPTFPSYKGGTVQALLVAQWNAWQSLNAAMTSATGTAYSALAQATAAVADNNAAIADYNQVMADINTAYAQVTAQNASFMAQQAMFNAQKATYDAQLTAAQTTASQDCDKGAFDAAVQAGWTGSAEDNDLHVSASGDVNGYNWSFSNGDSKSWSVGPLVAQAQKCQASQTALQQAITTTQVNKDALDVQLNALVAQTNALNIQNNGIATRMPAAIAHKEAAAQRLGASKAAVASQEGSAAQAVQTSMGLLLASITALDVAFAQADVDAAKIAVDQQQTNYDVRSRFGIRARYHNYDLWRARALTENARRLALAARRAIESRYVVDMSAMNSPEPFVDSPSAWADTVFASDLKPITIGLTPSPTSGNGVYTNVVKDYVNNLSLFLDGFPVKRPSATVISDADVIQISAPAAQVVSSSYGVPYNYIDPSSTGWSFYCDYNTTWVSDADIARFSTTTPSWTLATACNGGPPSLARLNFNLDPWGRPTGSVATPPYTSRYNVRVGGLALNLVGSGIRSCQKAPDPATCYAEPFIRYDLKQVGPAWVTSYDQDLRSLDIARAVVESGKALAIEEWLDPVTNGFNRPDVLNVARSEFQGRPIGGAWELTLRLTPDVNVERISRIQLLVQTAYWVREQQ